jgi:hypothetical protein
VSGDGTGLFESETVHAAAANAVVSETAFHSRQRRRTAVRELEAERA